jgi:amino acid transporter
MYPLLEKMNKFVEDHRGETNVLIAIITVVVATILIIVAAIIVSQVSSSISYTGLSASANTTISNTLAASFNSLNLLTIVLIVLAAAAIIAAVVGGLMFMRSRKE